MPSQLLRRKIQMLGHDIQVHKKGFVFRTIQDIQTIIDNLFLVFALPLNLALKLLRLDTQCYPGLMLPFGPALNVAGLFQDLQARRDGHLIRFCAAETPGQGLLGHLNFIRSNIA